VITAHQNAKIKRRLMHGCWAKVFIKLSLIPNPISTLIAAKYIQNNLNTALCFNLVPILSVNTALDLEKMNTRNRSIGFGRIRIPGNSLISSRHQQSCTIPIRFQKVGYK